MYFSFCSLFLHNPGAYILELHKSWPFFLPQTDFGFEFDVTSGSTLSNRMKT